MKKTTSLLTLLIFSSLVFSQEKVLNINQYIPHSANNAKFGRIIITPDYFKIEILALYTSYKKTSYDEFTVENLIPVKVEGYSVGTKTNKDFWVYVPRQYKKLYIRGINKFGQNTTLDLTPYEEYVKARTGRKGLDDSEKPKVYLNYPKLTNNFYRTEELYLSLEGKVTDNMGLLSFKINDEKVRVGDNGFYKKRLKLKLGINSVVLKAQDINNNTIYYDFVIVRDEIIEDTQFSDVDYPSATSNKNKNAIAVVFGIENYRNAPSVSFAVNDADIFREYLIKRFGLRRENIYMKLDEQATKGEFDKVFSSNGWISRHSSKKSDVFIYYAGHGAPDIKTKESYLIPYDGDPNYATSTGYAINDIYRNLSGIKAKSITIVLDACFSGSSRDNQPLLADARPIYIEVETDIVPQNTVVFSAASGKEISSSYKQKNHGIFTYFFLKGLQGDADGNKDRKITIAEMQGYLDDNVSVQARKMGREQNPQLLGTDKNRVLLKY